MVDRMSCGRMCTRSRVRERDLCIELQLTLNSMGMWHQRTCILSLHLFIHLFSRPATMRPWQESNTLRYVSTLLFFISIAICIAQCRECFFTLPFGSGGWHTSLYAWYHNAASAVLHVYFTFGAWVRMMYNVQYLSLFKLLQRYHLSKWW